MSSESTMTGAVIPALRTDASRFQWLRSWRAGAAIVGVLVTILWAPRMLGPIDLRYDAGVYYILGTSLAEGRGYRILSEPGAPTGIQYPPGLPALVALHQRILGTSEIEVVAPWLRRTYALLFLGLGLGVLTLGRAFGGPWVGLAATALCLLQANTYLLSDMLFTELPFSVISVCFVLVMMNRPLKERPVLREGVGFVLAVAAFMLRTAGLALLFAWVVEALVRRQWKLAGMRVVLGALPFLAWQGHVMQVQASQEYQQPAYEYQRASYQYYNVSYAENLALVDPFQPELGRLDAEKLVARVGANVLELPLSLGQVVSEPAGFWSAALDTVLGRKTPKGRPPHRVVYLPLLAWSALTVIGLVVLGARNGWFIIAFTAASIGLVSVTPWPSQFLRYLVPLGPFLALAAVLGVTWFLRRCGGFRSPVRRVASLGLIAGFFVVTGSVQAYAVWNSFLVRHFSTPTGPVAEPKILTPKWFYHDRTWADWNQAIDWIAQNTPRDAIIATDSPHLCYLKTGRLSVLAPMEADSARARELIEQVPVSYVIIDELAFLDVSRRYALPAVKNDPAQWKQVYVQKRTSIYQNMKMENTAPAEADTRSSSHHPGGFQGEVAKR